MLEPVAIGVDLGGTKIDIAIVDSSGKVRERQLLKTRVKEGPEAIVQDIAETVQDLRKKETNGEFYGVGVGVAGQIEKETGVVLFAPNLSWNNFPLQDELSDLLHLPTWVINDVRAATWGELLHGAGEGCEDVLCLFVGTGIGGGIISGGKFLIGSTNTAGEIGHMTIDLHGPKCTCGSYGCFESIAGGWGIARRIQEVLSYDPAGRQELLQFKKDEKSTFTAREVLEAYKKGIPAAEKVVEEVKAALVAGVSNLVNILNPEKIILGGGIIQGLPELIDVIHKGVSKRALKTPAKALQIVEAELKDEAGVIGAAAYAMQVYSKQGFLKQ